MSQENVEAFKRGLEAGNRGDIETLLKELDPEVEWHSALHALLGGEQTVFRGHDGVREMFRDLNEAFDEIHIEISEIRDLGDRLVAIGRTRNRGKASGVETDTPLALVTEVKNGRTISVRGYLDPKQALEAVGLSEQAMSQENVEIVRAVYGQWGKGDFRASADLLDPHVVLVLGPEFPDAGMHSGVEAVAAYTRGLLEPWTHFTMKAEEIIGAGDSVLVAVRQHGVGSTSGVPAVLSYFTLWTFRGRKVIHIESFRERAEALDAAGLSE